MDSYAQYHAQQPAAYPHAHNQHPNQPSPVIQTNQGASYAQHQQGQQMAHPQMMTTMPYNAGYAMQQPYGVSPSHAAAMATAAASGYPTYSMPDQANMGALPQTSPRLAQVKTGAANMSRTTEQSPRQEQMGAPGTLPGQMTLPSAQAMPAGMAQMQAQSLPARRMSHVSSPAVQNPQQGPGGMNAPPRPAVPPQAAPAQQAPQPPQEVPGAGQVEESPLYVNAKQFHRILKRRMARQKLEEALRLTNKGRKPYLHESRHNHAMRRPRGPGGRFLTAEEVSQMEAQNGGGATNGDSNATPATNGSAKRKRDNNGDAKSETPSKKVKSDEEEEDDDEDDEES